MDDWNRTDDIIAIVYVIVSVGGCLILWLMGCW